MNENNFKGLKGQQKQLIKVMCLSFIALFLSACQPQETETEVSYYDLPETEIIYSNEEVVAFNNRVNQGQTNRYEGLVIRNTPLLVKPEVLPTALFYDSGIDIAYPEEGVKGIYLTADTIADEEYFNYIIDYINSTELNAVVIDFKDDHGNIIPTLDSSNPVVQENVLGAIDLTEVLKVLEENQIYPIARLVTFKDYLLSEQFPELSFHDTYTGEIWQDGNGAQFINPFLREVWDYNIEIATEAAKMGFKEVQFDYIRFPEGFESFAEDLEYEIGDYASYVSDIPEEEGYERVAAINDFLEYAGDRLAPYGVDISADVFGYTAVAGDAPDVRGIGQNFSQMAEHVDVISSMIYPSHWGVGFFGIDYPDLHPYDVVTEYMFTEEYALQNVQNNVTSRPWLQDFTDYFLPEGTYQVYGPQQVQEQIVALHEQGIHEFLLWNAGGVYTEGVDYAPEISGIEYYY